MLILTKVVENGSSALDYALEQKDFINANHINMCRFSGFDDDGYEKVRAGIAHCLGRDAYDAPQSMHAALAPSLS